MRQSAKSTSSPVEAPVGAPAPNGAVLSVLADYLSEHELAKQLGVGLRTLRRWRALRQSPPYVVVARQLYFRRSAVEDWLRKRERDFEAPTSSKARHVGSHR